MAGSDGIGIEPRVGFCFSRGFGALYATGLWRDPTGSALSRAWKFASRVGLVRFTHGILAGSNGIGVEPF